MKEGLQQGNVVQERYGNGKIQQKVSHKWYGEKKNPHECAMQVVHKIKEDTSYRESLNSANAALYSPINFLFQRTPSKSLLETKNLNVTYNVIKSCVDTATSIIGKMKPRAQFLTENGSWELKNRAKKLSKYVDGVFEDTNLYVKAQQMFLDACVLDMGCLKFYTDDGEIKVERVLSTEILVDGNDGRHKQPQQLFQTKLLPRESVIDMFPEHQKEIEALVPEYKEETTIDMVEVYEGWYLHPKWGRHIIFIESCTLFDEKYEKDFFPFVFFRWSDRLVGFYGRGLAESLAGFQTEINRVMQAIRESQHFVAKPRIFLEEGSNVVKSHLNSDVGTIISFKGQSPIIQTPVGQNAEVYNHLRWLIEAAYQESGISQLSATSKKPTGLDSGVALREFQDIESERFAVISQQYERCFINAARIIVDLSRELYGQKDGERKFARISGKDFIEKIDWKDVDMEDDKYMMKIYPTNLLPSSPAGKLQRVQEMYEQQMIDKDQAMELLDFPDLEKFTSRANASIHLVEKSVSEIITKRKYTAPEPELNFDYAIQLTNNEYLQAKLDGAPSKVLKLLLRYADDCRRMKTLKLKKQMEEQATLQQEMQGLLPQQPAGQPQPGQPQQGIQQ